MPEPAFDTGRHLDGESWRELAACKGADTSLFFLEKGFGSAGPAKEFCHRCPVQAACLDYAERSPQARFGVWGALTEEERRGLRRRTRLRIVDRSGFPNRH